MKKLMSISLAIALLTLLAGSALASGGDTIYAVVFRENATTGYTWAYENSDDSILTVDDQGCADTDEQAMGAGSVHTWVISGRRAGECGRNLHLCAQLGKRCVRSGDCIFLCHGREFDSAAAVRIGAAGEIYARICGRSAYRQRHHRIYVDRVHGRRRGACVGYRFLHARRRSGRHGRNRRRAYVCVQRKRSGRGNGDLRICPVIRSDQEPAATVTVAYTVDDQLNVTQTSVGGDYDDYAADVDVTQPAE